MDQPIESLDTDNIIDATIVVEDEIPLIKKVIQPIKEWGLKETLRWLCGLCCLGCCLLLCLVLLILCLVFYFVFRFPITTTHNCEASCQFSLVESIPTEMNISHLHSLPSHDVVMHMLSKAKVSVKTLQFYFELKNDADPAAHGDYGNEILAMYIDTAKRGIDLQIIYNKVTEDFEEEVVDIDALKDAGATVYSIDFEKYFGGVLHSKVIIVDDDTFYLGSLNMDWKSFSQVKELGIYVRNCPCLAKDVTKIFDVMRWYMKDEQVDEGFDTAINANKSMRTKLAYIDGLEHFNETEETKGNTFITASPDSLNTLHRTSDLDGILHVIERAEQFIYVSVMDFLPFQMYREPKQYWGVLVDALKDAMTKRNVEILLLISHWNYTNPMQPVFLREMNTFGKICKNSGLGGATPFCTGKMETKEFIVPDAKEFSPPYDHTRVNHPKFMVTDRDSFVSTSNWCQDYFVSTAGMSFISDHEVLRSQLVDLFNRDWTGVYSHELKDLEECQK